jgi:hypothetical protein
MNNDGKVFYVNGKVGVNVLKCLITAISVAIAMPGLWEKDYRVVTLTLLVFYLSKIVEAVDGLESDGFPHERLVRILQCIIGIAAIAACFYYLAVSVSEIGVTIITDNPNIKIIYSAGLVSAAAAFFAIDLLICGISFFKKYRTVKAINKIINR